jgi:hypothetical protein
MNKSGFEYRRLSVFNNTSRNTIIHRNILNRDSLCTVCLLINTNLRSRKAIAAVSIKKYTGVNSRPNSFMGGIR